MQQGVLLLRVAKQHMISHATAAYASRHMSDLARRISQSSVKRDLYIKSAALKARGVVLKTSCFGFQLQLLDASDFESEMELFTGSHHQTSGAREKL